MKVKNYGANAVGPFGSGAETKTLNFFTISPTSGEIKSIFGRLKMSRDTFILVSRILKILLQTILNFFQGE
jgi:hypothetical protein